MLLPSLVSTPNWQPLELRRQYRPWMSAEKAAAGKQYNNEEHGRKYAEKMSAY